VPNTDRPAWVPAVHTVDELEAVAGDEAIFRPAAADLAARYGLAGQELRRYPAGSSPCYAVGDRHVVKLYPALPGFDAAAEARVLEFLRGRLPVATPEVTAHGEYENGWRFVLMSQLPGEDLAEAWPRIPPGARDRIADQVGELLTVLHGLNPAPLDGLIGPANWGEFVAGQRATAVPRQREAGLPEPWLEQIPGFLDTVPLAREPGRVLLHTEVMREHFVVDPAGWTLSGILDFEPAMIGDPAYEFGAVGVFTSRGDARLLGRIMAAYGRGYDPRELLAQLLLHVYSDLPWYLGILPPPPEPTLESVADAWFGAG
jgi:hygromycin-B 7''-O-kinase